MTLDDLLARDAIRDTMARYNIAGDRLRAEDFAAVFTEDGVLESEGTGPHDAFRYDGRAAIYDWMARWSQPRDRSGVHQASFVRHHLATSQIDLTGEGEARARTYWTAYTDIGPDHCGVYVDRYRKVGDRWLIAHRRVRLDWRSPQGLFATAVQNSRE